MRNSLIPGCRRAVIFASTGAVLATVPILGLLSARQAGHVSGFLYHGVTGLCIGVSVVLIALASRQLRRDRREAADAAEFRARFMREK